MSVKIEIFSPPSLSDVRLQTTSPLTDGSHASEWWCLLSRSSSLSERCRPWSSTHYIRHSAEIDSTSVRWIEICYISGTNAWREIIHCYLFWEKTVGCPLARAWRPPTTVRGEENVKRNFYTHASILGFPSKVYKSLLVPLVCFLNRFQWLIRNGTMMRRWRTTCGSAIFGSQSKWRIQNPELSGICRTSPRRLPYTKNVDVTSFEGSASKSRQRRRTHGARCERYVCTFV